MISPQEIRTVTFDKSMRGYRTEDVDAFLQQIADQVQQLVAEKEDKEQKLYILAEKIEEYRKDEDNLKSAFLNAQRMGENVIKEAKQKAESILREAGIKAEDMTRNAREEAQEEALRLEQLKVEVAQFKNKVLGLYKQHIESLTTLPGDEDEEQTPEELLEAADELAAVPAEPIIARPEEPIAPQPVISDPIEAFPDLKALYDSAPPAEEAPVHSSFGWQPQEPAFTYIPEELPEEEDEEEEPAAPSGLFEGFQGIKFSD